MNIYTKIGIITIALFFVFNVTFAASLGGSIFGGRIIRTEAIEVTIAEADGYKCNINGSTLEIRSYKGPTSYFIPAGTKPKTNTTPTVNQTTLGKYSGQETIVCEKTDEDGNKSQRTIILDIIKFFGTSKR